VSGCNRDIWWKVNKIKNITSDGIEGRHHHNAGRIDEDEDESEPRSHLYLCLHAADAE
jgi:hypothetical protein